jgi:hypothetical protein
MNFAHCDLGQQRAGSTAVITLRGTEANVHLMDSSNFASFQSTGNARQAYGGGVHRGSSGLVQISIPHDGHWHAVAWLPPGLSGHVQMSARVVGQMAA